MTQVGEAQRLIARLKRDTGRGLLIPNPLNGLRSPLLPVMTSPPTVEHETGTLAGTNSDYSALGGTQWSRTLNFFRYFGAVPVNAGALSPDNVLYKPSNLSLGWAVDWMSDSAKPEIITKPNGGKYRLYIDGAPVQDALDSAGSADGNTYITRLTLAGRANRHYLLQLANNVYFGGVRTDVRETVWRAATPNDDVRVVVLGDSFTEGTGAPSPDGFTWAMSRLLGWPDTHASGSGATGYLNPGPSPRVAFQARVQTDVIDLSPDIVIVAGGINDSSGYTANQIQTAAELLYDTIRAALPGATLIVLSPWWKDGQPSFAIRTVRDAIQAACVNRAHLFIDSIVATSGTLNTLGWITGTGHVGGTTSEGNADYYISSDGTHPSNAGHWYLGYRLASAIAGWITAGAPKNAIWAGNGPITIAS